MVICCNQRAHFSTKYVVLTTIVACTLSFSAGCTGLEPAAIGAGATAAESGVTFFSKGKARSFEPAVYSDVLAAVRAAGAALAFEVRSDERADGRGRVVPPGDAAERRARLVFADEKGETIVIVVERRTERITMLQSDVGVLGLTGLATTLTARVQAELRASGAYGRGQEQGSRDQGTMGSRFELDASIP